MEGNRTPHNGLLLGDGRKENKDALGEAKETKDRQAAVALVNVRLGDILRGLFRSG